MSTGRKNLQAWSAFTLIEMLVVVVVISLLTAIAVPNFLAAHIRAKVSLVENDMRVVAMALESYAVDHNQYPPATGVGVYKGAGPAWFATPVSLRLIPLTTPIGYISSVPQEAFAPYRAIGQEDLTIYDTFDYVDARSVPVYGCGLTSGGEWRLASAGPDGVLAFGGCALTQLIHPAANIYGVDYDPTNGIVSAGDLVRVGPPSTFDGNPLDFSNPNRPGIVRAPGYLEQFR